MKKFKHKDSNVEARKSGIITYSLYVNEKQIGISGFNRIENDPDNWIEQPEKDYEILKYRTSGIEPYKTTIDSVKRLSDGEVFSVGDMHRSRHIGSLRINKMYEKYGTIWLDHECGATRLDNAEKVTRKPVLTTEDGVELYEGDKFEGYKKCDGTIFTDRIEKAYDPVKDIIYFSTLKAAEEYRLNNARVLSYNDVQEYYPYMLFPQGVEGLKELIKSRLK